MKAILLEDKEGYNKFVSGLRRSQLLQSWEWGEFERKTGRKVVRFGVEDEKGVLRAAATLSHVKLPLFKSYLYCPHGPVFSSWTREVGTVFFRQVEKLCDELGSIFFRFNSGFIMDEISYPIVATIGALPSFTVILELKHPEEKLLGDMSKDTQEKLKSAEAEGLKVRVGKAGDFDGFWRVMLAVHNRDRYLPHIRDYYLELLKLNFVRMYVLEKRGEPHAVGLFAFWGDTVTYLSGGSANDYAKTNTAHYLLWQVIKAAKAEAYAYFDLFGMDELRWPELSAFKSSFAREKLELPGMVDMVFAEQWYGMYQFVKKVRKWF